jgi:hypothetical protein
VQLTPQQEARNNKAHQSGDGNLFGGNSSNPITGQNNQAKPKNQRSKQCILAFIFLNSKVKKIFSFKKVASIR